MDIEDLYSWIAFNNNPNFANLSEEEKKRIYKLRLLEREQEIYQYRMMIGSIQSAGSGGGGSTGSSWIMGSGSWSDGDSWSEVDAWVD